MAIASKEMFEELGEQTWFCPICAQARTFRLRARVRKPRLALGRGRAGVEVARFEECTGCWASFRVGTLGPDSKPGSEHPPLAVFQELVLDVLVSMAVADDDLDARERALVEQVGACLRIPAALLAAHLDRAAHEGPIERTTILANIAESREFLNEDGRALVLVAAFHVAAADGRFDARERAFLAEVAQVLGIGRGQAQIIFELAESADALLERLAAFIRREDEWRSEIEVRL